MNTTFTPGEPEPTPPQPAVAPLAHVRVESTDFDRIAQALHFLKADLRQLSGGPFHGVVERCTVGPYLILQTRVNRVIQARGAVQPSTRFLSLVTCSNEQAAWRGQHRKPGDINLNAPATEIDHLTGRDYTSLTIGVDVARFRLAAQTLRGIDIEERLRGKEGLQANPQAFASLEALVRTILADAGTASSLLNAPQQRIALAEALTLCVLDVVTGTQGAAETMPSSNRRQLARRAEDFMAAHLRSPLLISDLCKELAVSERALRYAFAEQFGLSPLAYFKRQKLNAIRQQLKQTNPATVGVQSLIKQWGIVHPGNFAADYRRLFGELPSATARQRTG